MGLGGESSINTNVWVQGNLGVEDLRIAVNKSSDIKKIENKTTKIKMNHFCCLFCFVSCREKEEISQLIRAP